MSDSKQSSNLMAFGFLFTLIAVVALIALILSNSSADTVQNAAITPATPVLTDDMTVATSSYGTAAATVTPVAGTTKTIYVHGSVTDDNGCETIDSETYWDAAVYRTTAQTSAGAACSADGNDCIQPTGTFAFATNPAGGMSCVDSDDLVMSYQYTADLQYFADATIPTADTHSADTWTAYVKVTDPESSATDTDTQTFEVDNLFALNVEDTTVEYGEIALGGTSATPVGTTISNYGNVVGLDPYVSQINAAADTGDSTGRWDCTVGFIPVTGTTWSSTSGGTYSAMTNSGVITDLSIALAASALDVDAQEDVFTKLTIPASGVGGSCESTLVIGAGSRL